MPESRATKSFMLVILEVLKTHSDENHRLTQKEIQDYVSQDHKIKIGRKAIKRNLENLIDLDYDIEYETTEGKNGKLLFSKWYIQRDFADEELRLLVDSVFLSAYIPATHKKQLIEKLVNQSSKHFRKRVEHVKAMPINQPVNDQLFNIISILHEAISEKRKVVFNCVQYGTDKKPHLAKNPDGTIMERTVNPYQMITKNGKYYLICSFDTGKLYHYRLDIMSNTRILDDSSIRPFDDVKGARKLNISRYSYERMHMYSGDAITVSFRASKKILLQIYDLFGLDVNLSQIDEDELTVNVSANKQDMLYFALQFGMNAKILSPQSLVEEVKKAIEEMTKNSRK